MFVRGYQNIFSLNFTAETFSNTRDGFFGYLLKIKHPNTVILYLNLIYIGPMLQSFYTDLRQ